MKKFLIIVFCMSILSTSYAKEPVCNSKTGKTEVKEQLNITTDVPKFLEGAVIIVRLKNGTETSVPAEKFKVVARQQQFIVTKTETKILTNCSIDGDKNRISALGGIGLDGSTTTSVSGSTVEVKAGKGPVGGLQYQRKLGDTFSLGVQGQTNGNGFFIVGLDF